MCRLRYLKTLVIADFDCESFCLILLFRITKYPPSRKRTWGLPHCVHGRLCWPISQGWTQRNWTWSRRSISYAGLFPEACGVHLVSLWAHNLVKLSCSASVLLDIVTTLMCVCHYWYSLHECLRVCWLPRCHSCFIYSSNRNSQKLKSSLWLMSTLKLDKWNEFLVFPSNLCKSGLPSIAICFLDVRFSFEDPLYMNWISAVHAQQYCEILFSSGLNYFNPCLDGGPDMTPSWETPYTISSRTIRVLE